ncbi:ATP-binding protein [Oscillatoria sp. HE19RPO]|uniref:slr1658 superfamily regulator n=1 Tax=Oscillatoria sp. HE19RPO TaxID=2954806 RepID=UPI0020C54EFB|nr:ATP-binding protein [Oscillatoria sp. HE19RPO]
MTEIFGDFIEDLPKGTEYLILGFSPASIPLKQRWRNNGLSADFLADYLTTFFPSSEETASHLNKKAEIQSAVSYIANELLENAMKFSVETQGYPISIQLHLNSERIIFVTTNSICREKMGDFQAFLIQLSTEDPLKLYMDRLEKNALEDINTASGLGFLTMIIDYGAKIGWKFQEMNGEKKAIAVTTMVQILL